MTRRIYLRREDRYMRAARLGETVSKGQAATTYKFIIKKVNTKAEFRKISPNCLKVLEK